MIRRLAPTTALLASLLALGLPAAAAAQDASVAAPQDDDGEFVPGVLYAVGEKFDKSFNESAYDAMQAFAERTGAAFLEYQPATPAQFEQGIDAMARRGADIIIVIGFYYAEPLAQVAPRYPDVKFTLIDAVADAPNVQSVTFREQEGSFLTGVLAAMAGDTDAVGFVAAMDIPLIRKFIVGYEEGVHWVEPDTEVLVNFVGTTPEAFNDPTTAAELARSQVERGADVIFAGAGNSNNGVFQTAVDQGVLAIGVDSNQNYLHPGTILTSMLKRVDVAVTDALTGALLGTWQAGPVDLGLAERGVGYAVDANNWPMLTPAMIARVEDAMTGILTGEIEVTDPTAAP